MANIELIKRPGSTNETLLCRLQHLEMNVEPIEPNKTYKVRSGKYAYLVIYRDRDKREQFGVHMTVNSNVPAQVTARWDEKLILEVVSHYCKEHDYDLNLVRNTGNGQILYENDLLYNDEDASLHPFSCDEDPGEF